MFLWILFYFFISLEPNLLYINQNIWIHITFKQSWWSLIFLVLWIPFRNQCLPDLYSIQRRWFYDLITDNKGKPWILYVTFMQYLQTFFNKMNPILLLQTPFDNFNIQIVLSENSKKDVKLNYFKFILFGFMYTLEFGIRFLRPFINLYITKYK